MRALLAFVLVCLLVSGTQAGFRLRERHPNRELEHMEPRQFVHSEQLQEFNTCHVMHNPDNCNANNNCNWCTSNANIVPPFCYSKDESKKLPLSMFTCKKPITLEISETAVDCTSLTSQTSCDGQTGCTWCKSGAIPSKCYSLENAAKLPAGVFVCDAAPAPSAAPVVVEPVVPVADVDCSTLTSQTSCDGQTGCTWCKSGAIPSKCYSFANAAKLPAGVFVCDAAPAPSAAPVVVEPVVAVDPVPVSAVDCSTLTSQTSCDGQTGCTWCKSGAIPSKCYSFANAAKLPAGVFVCDTTPAADSTHPTAAPHHGHHGRHGPPGRPSHHGRRGFNPYGSL